MSQNRNIILDYEQVEEKLRQLETRDKIITVNDLGTSTYGLPIHHYTIGNGKKEIVVTGATHGSEIISTDFVLHLMEKLSNDNYEGSIDLNEYTIHFIPMLNPEGYLISTSAVRQIIPRDMSSEETERICKEYYSKYKADDIEAKQRRESGESQDRNPEHLRLFQEMFKDVDYTCIPEKYAEIRESVRRILEKYPDIPKGTLQVWSANANGIDPQANSEYNDILTKRKNGELGVDEAVHVNNLRYANMNCAHPGPLNCGYDPEIGFETEPEIGAITGLLSKLSEKGTLHSYFNFHSTGAKLYQRPGEPIEEMGISTNTIWTRILENFALSKFYARKTYKEANNKEKSKYLIITDREKITSSNDIFRIMYPRDILIELSGMGGNPIGPYGDIEGNYKNLIQSNLDAFEFAVNFSDISEKISSASYQMYRDKLKDGIPENIVQQMYQIIGTASNMMMSWIERFGRKTRREVLHDLSQNSIER